MNRAAYEERTEKLLQPITDSHGFELVDVEFVKEGTAWYLRGYIDKPGGVTVDDCEAVSRELESRLDEEDFIAESYVLEISSPGLGRVLKKEKDFVRSRGKKIEVHLYRPFEHEKEWEGILESWDTDTVTITTDEGREISFPKTDVSLIREYVEW